MPKVRVSIANLAWYTRCDQGSNVREQFAILNPSKLKEDKRQYAALGGGAMLTGQGKHYLEEHFGASGFEFDEHTGLFDARCVIDELFVEPTFRFFTRIAGTDNPFEHDPTLDILSEMTGEEVPGYQIMSKESATKVALHFLKVVEQAPAKVGADTSVRASVQMPTRRLFRIYELVMPLVIHHFFCRSPLVNFLTDEELSTTNGGATAGVANDGTSMQNNLFLT